MPSGESRFVRTISASLVNQSHLYPQHAPYRRAGLETAKHAERRERYYKNLEEMLAKYEDITDLVFYFPIFAGDVTIARFLFLCEMYKLTLGTCGHILEAGIYKGTSVFPLQSLCAYWNLNH